MSEQRKSIPADRFRDFTDVTEEVRGRNPELNETDRVFTVPGQGKVKVRAQKGRVRREYESATGYVMSISIVDDDGRAKPKGGRTREEVDELLQEEGADPDPRKLFDISEEHSVTLVLDGDIDVQESLQGIIAQQVDRFLRIQEKRQQIEEYFTSWSG